MRVLIDNGIVSGANFLEGAVRQQELRWGKNITSLPISGFKRVDLDPNVEQQAEKDALFSIGRLARAGLLSLHTYSELRVESWRGGRGRQPILNALGKCIISECPCPVERTKFRQTLNHEEWLSKGGKEDLKKGIPRSDFSQVSFLEWLASMTSSQVNLIIEKAGLFGLDDFEAESLEDLSWFQNLYRAIGGEGNLPDCFHICTARRNKLDALLTLEAKLPRTWEHLKKRRNLRIDVNVEVFRPRQLLSALGLNELDPVPVEGNRFYSVAEALELNRRLLEA